MRLINNTRMAAGYNVALEPSGRELLVVVVKGTFTGELARVRRFDCMASSCLS